MKKILVLTIAMFSLLACSSDDENNLDPIIGTWYLFSENGIEVNDCIKKSTTTFSEDGTYTVSTSYYLSENNECIPDEGSADDGAWINRGEGNYSRTPTGEIIDDETIKTTFSDNNNTMTYSYEDGGETTVYTHKRK